MRQCRWRPCSASTGLSGEALRRGLGGRTPRRRLPASSNAVRVSAPRRHTCRRSSRNRRGEASILVCSYGLLRAGAGRLSADNSTRPDRDCQLTMPGCGRILRPIACRREPEWASRNNRRPRADHARTNSVRTKGRQPHRRPRSSFDRRAASMSEGRAPGGAEQPSRRIGDRAECTTEASKNLLPSRGRPS